MDNKVSQYQRAVTPTIDGGGSSVVRGKILSYSNQPNSNNNSTVLSRNARPTSVGPTAAAMGYRGGTGMGSMVSPRSSSGQAVDITIQGKNTTSATTPSTSSNTQPTNNNNNNNGGIAAGRTVLNPPIPASMMNSSLLDQFNNISFLPRYDLVPLSEDIPADGIIFAKNKNQHDSLVIFRTPEERMRNPERLNLDRRQLEQCPMLEQEQRLRLLNYQNNAIKYISNVENLPNLIFLDLYNNQIMSLEGPLSSVRGLRVLMAGKNKIQKIQNLQHLKKLDVLDLHSNEIKVIEGLDGLTDLRVLNLAGNRISIVNNLTTLASLTELNLRRNRIQYVQGLEKLPALQRVFLSHNSVQSLKDVWCLFEIQYLIELSLDGNPVAEADPVKYREHIIRSIPTLKHLDLKRITDEDRNVIVGYGAGSDKASSSSSAAASVDDNNNNNNSNNPLQVSSQPTPSDYATNANNNTNNPTSQDAQQQSQGTFRNLISDLPPTGGSKTPRLSANNLEAHEPMLRPKKSFSLDANGEFYLPATSGKAVTTTSDDVDNGDGNRSDDGNQDNFYSEKQSSSNNNSNSNSNQSNYNHGDRGSDGIALLARAGRLSRAQAIFDIEVLGADEKVLVIVGDAWDWNAPKRLLNAVTEACALHIRRESLMTKFNSSHMNSLTSLKTMRFLFNDFTNLKQVEFIPAVYGSIEHLVIQENPIQQAAPSILRNFMIASMPKLKTFNQTMITATERQAAEKAYQPFLGLRNKGIKSFTASASKLSKQQAEEQHIPSRNESYQQIGSVKFVNGTASKSASTAQLPKAEVRINYEDFSQEFDLLIKELVAQSITGCNLRSSTHANGNSSPAK